MQDYIDWVYSRTVDVLRENKIQTYLDSRTPPCQPLRSSKFISFGFVLKSPSDLPKLEKLTDIVAYASGVNQVMSSREGGTLWFQYELPKKHWTSQNFLDIDKSGIGVSSSGIVVPHLGDIDPHFLVAGSSGSGKSEMVKTILSYFICNYTSHSLRFAIVDPHKDFEGFDNSVHMVGRASEEKDIIYLINSFYGEHLQRKRANYRRGTRLVLVLDEASSASVLGNKESGFNDENFDKIRTIAAESRKYLITLILSTQKPNHTDLPRVFDNLTQRYIGKVADSLVATKLTGQSSTEAQKLLGMGDFLQVAGGQITRFQAAMVTDYSFIQRGVCPIPLGEYKRFEDGIKPNILKQFLNKKINEKEAKEKLNLDRESFERYSSFAEELNKC